MNNQYTTKTSILRKSVTRLSKQICWWTSHIITCAIICDVFLKFYHEVGFTIKLPQIQQTFCWDEVIWHVSHPHSNNNLWIVKQCNLKVISCANSKSMVNQPNIHKFTYSTRTNKNPENQNSINMTHIYVTHEFNNCSMTWLQVVINKVLK